MITCFEVADYFIWLANENEYPIGNLKLQKLVYYSQAWYLAFVNKPLFSEDFEAWVHGPVIRALYNEYKIFRWKPIYKVVSPNLSSDLVDFLAFVADEYFWVDPYDLEAKTHSEDPWIIARKGLPPDAPSNNIIEKHSIQEYYLKRVKQRRQQLTEEIL